MSVGRGEHVHVCACVCVCVCVCVCMCVFTEICSYKASVQQCKCHWTEKIFSYSMHTEIYSEERKETSYVQTQRQSG
jgi:hypothetical protein